MIGTFQGGTMHVAQKVSKEEVINWMREVGTKRVQLRRQEEQKTDRELAVEFLSAARDLESGHHQLAELLLRREVEAAEKRLSDLQARLEAVIE